MVKSMHGTLGFSNRVSDFCRREADDVPKDKHLTLILRKLFECSAESTAAIEIRLSAAMFICPRALTRGRALGSKMIKGSVARDAQNPGLERNLTLLVFLNDYRQLGEDVLGYVFGLTVVPNKAGDI